MTEPAVPERVGVLGGSFDPPHTGHLLLATEALERLGLDRVVVVPAGTQPLKPVNQDGTPVVSPHHRLAMAHACFAGMSRVMVDSVEVDRGGLSYTVDTVAELRRRSPHAELLLLLGDDAVAQLDRWKDPQRLLQLAQLVVVDRTEDRAGVGTRLPWSAWPDILPPIRLVMRRVEISSSEIRARVAAGQSIRGFVPDAVAAYIASHGLYS